MSERLNADAPVTAVASANQASLRFGDACVVPEDILRLDSEGACRACRRGMAAPLCSPATSGMSGTFDTTADSNGRVSVVRRVALPGSALFAPASWRRQEAARRSRKCSCKCAAEPDAQAAPGVCRVPRWSCSGPKEAGHGSLGLEPRQGGQRACRGCGRCRPGAGRGRKSPCAHDARRPYCPERLASASPPPAMARSGLPSVDCKRL